MSFNHLTSDCIEHCLACSQICYSTAVNHCLEAGGRHVAPGHFTLMLNCAKVCETCATLQMSNSSFSFHMCSLCAEICEACAEDCANIGDMADCVTACTKCAESCREMAS
ncbi:hypothetical protein J2X05_002915 [Cellvibrio fibrivorans]|jgi:hypothetical protein|uniref:Four-helix bundle copper-binding protein n=1 Tax=Cellvibrio fibrivorans TaxID=126350 RepID=A0ABU1V0C6_9GAMM|nr:hypothetical protein [Cellvibrio fibrivorans]